MGDPAASVPGYKWMCSNCAGNGLRGWWTMRLVKTFINPANPLPSLGKKATIYCANCPKGARLFCTGCAGRLHNVGTKAQHHSLEAIDPTQSRSLFYLAPLFDFLLVPTVVLFTVLFVGIPAGYMSGRDVCPGTHFVRTKMYHFDSGLTFLLKEKLALTCNLEDGYFRLILDTWVRAISTDSDSLLLLYSAVARSVVFHTVAIRLILLPFFATINQILSVIVYLACQLMARLGYGATELIPPRWRARLSALLTDLQERADTVSWKLWWWTPATSTIFSKTTLAAFPDMVGKIPPATLPRTRPRTDYMDAYKYWKDRQLRMIEFFRDTAKTRLEVLAAVVPLMAVIIRVLCITTSFDWYVRKVLLMPGNVADSGADVPGDALGHTIDKLISALLPVALSYVPVSSIICGCLLFLIYRYPKFRNYLDTRGTYGGHCGKAPITVTTGKCRWLPQTFEPVIQQ